MGLRFEITDLWYPDGSGGWDPAVPVIFSRLRNFTDGEVVIPINGQRTATVTITPSGRGAEFAWPYGYFLRAFYDGDCVFWGAITSVELDTSQRTVKVSAVDRSDPLVHHFLRYGDQALNSASHPTLPNSYNRQVPANGDGIEMLLDAAQNLAGHQANTYPPLGIAYVYDDTAALTDTTPLKAKFERGASVWESAVSLTPQSGSTDVGLPDFELAPVVDQDGVYAQLNVFQRQGDYDPVRDRTFTKPIVIHAGFGKANADLTPYVIGGGKLVTHAHVLSDDAKKRVTRASSSAASGFGVYVDWDQTDYKANQVDLLTMRGDETIRVYSRPLPSFTITPKVSWGYHYLTDYIVGGTAQIVLRMGKFAESHDARITQVTLRQADQANNTQELITALPTEGSSSPGDEEA